MKYLLLFLVFLAFGWHWRNRRIQQMQQRADRTQGAGKGGTIDMVPCAHCGTHLPQHEAIAGRLGHYCSAAHRAARES